jgi:hypothetical protein
MRGPSEAVIGALQRTRMKESAPYIGLTRNHDLRPQTDDSFLIGMAKEGCRNVPRTLT